MRLFSPACAVVVLTAAAPAQQPAGKDAGAGLTDQLDALCQPMIDAEIAVGLVVGVVDGEATVVRGYGKVAIAGDRAPDGGTLYEIGSISKVFTGLLFADAIERGVVALDDPVQKHLPAGVVMPMLDGKPVLLWHLTTHTSGLPRVPYGEPPNADDPYAHLTPETLCAALGEVLLRGEPGATYEYSNLGAGLLGQVLVWANGKPSYDELLRQRIAGPLGLLDTGVRLAESQRACLAPPYDSEGDPAHNWDLAALAGAGGIRSSVDDMLKFARAQWDHGQSPLAAALDRSQHKLHDGTGGIALAYGWHFARDQITLWHNGQTGGYHGYLAVEPKLRRAVCMLGNTARGEMDAVGERILQHLDGRAVQPLEYQTAVAVDRAVLERYVGHYRMAGGIAIEVTLRPRGLYAQLSHQPPFRLFASSPTEFFYRVTPASVSFEGDGDGVKALVLHQNGRDTRFPRIAVVEVK